MIAGEGVELVEARRAEPGAVAGVELRLRLGQRYAAVRRCVSYSPKAVVVDACRRRQEPGRRISWTISCAYGLAMSTSWRRDHHAHRRQAAPNRHRDERQPLVEAERATIFALDTLAVEPRPGPNAAEEVAAAGCMPWIAKVLTNRPLSRETLAPTRPACSRSRRHCRGRRRSCRTRSERPTALPAKKTVTASDPVFAARRESQVPVAVVLRFPNSQPRTRRFQALPRKGDVAAVLRGIAGEYAPRQLLNDPYSAPPL